LRRDRQPDGARNEQSAESAQSHGQGLLSTPRVATRRRTKPGPESNATCLRQWVSFFRCFYRG
jgi:hypothetical protein